MARIAVVDDQHDILHLLSTCLNMHGHEVELAKSKNELMPILVSFKPQLIILDVNLAGENGRDICKEIKTAEHRHIPIILYSANPELLANYEECQANDTLEKPFEIKVLIKKVDRALGGKQEKK